MRKIKTKFILPLIVLGLVACNNTHVSNEESTYLIKGDTVFVKDTALASKIKISNVNLEPYSKEVITAGTVQPIPNQFAHVAPPFSGRIIKSYIKLGQKVSVNTPLFEISSPDFTAAQKEFYQAKSSRELAQKELQRKQDLLKNGVGSQKELDEASSELQIAEKEYENAYAALKVYQVNPANMTLGQALIVRSPIAGSIIEDNIVTGQYVKDDAEPIASIADLSQVWITAQVKEKDIRFVNEGDIMDVHISALPGKVVNGKVFHIKEAVDEDTRSINVLSVCDNKEDLLKIGMYTTIHFSDKPTPHIHIPEKALLQGENDTYVFVQIAPNTYLRTPVEVESSKDGKAVISKGLNPDQKIISEGGYYLK